MRISNQFKDVMQSFHNYFSSFELIFLHSFQMLAQNMTFLILFYLDLVYMIFMKLSLDISNPFFISSIVIDLALEVLSIISEGRYVGMYWFTIIIIIVIIYAVTNISYLFIPYFWNKPKLIINTKEVYFNNFL